MSYLLTYGAADYYAALEWVAAVVAIIILISSLDDLFIDIYFWVRETYRALTIKRVYRPLTVEQLLERPEQPFAIMIPAWLEADVIAGMLETLVDTLDYRDYTIFVGTYPNDAATIVEVERMRRRIKQLQRVEVPHPGPTSKADCLNWVVQAIFLYEQEKGIEFTGVILHDSEDVTHPLEMRLFNYLIPRKDLIQLPVISLEREWFELVAGTYMDEFAEWHAKDLPVRESISGMVPSAGVGTGFSRRALLALCDTNNNRPFNTESVTEDYDIGMRLSRLGMRSIFVRFPVKYQVKRYSWLGTGVHTTTLDMPLCVREYFPDTFRAAYRQRARWTLGIALQSWRQQGWPGSLATKYLLVRDRKSIITSIVSTLAYFLVLNFVGFYIAAELGAWTLRYPPLFTQNSWILYILWFNTFALLLRITQRGYFVWRLYGWQQAILSVPRLVVCNAVNFMATLRAWRIFIQTSLYGQPVTWDKTMHAFPTADELLLRRRRLGDLLMSWQVLDEARLEHALTLQSERDIPLGRLLIFQGWLDDETLAEAISAQSDLPRAHIDAATVQRYGRQVDLALCVRHRFIFLGAEDGTPRIAVGGPLKPEVLTLLTPALGGVPEQMIARESEIAAALRLLTEQGDTFDTSDKGSVPLLGDLLIEQGLLQRAAFDAAMEDYRPERDGRIGDHLVARGVVTREAVETAQAEQRRRFEQLAAV